jgi:hypothetical protein
MFYSVFVSAPISSGSKKDDPKVGTSIIGFRPSRSWLQNAMEFEFKQLMRAFQSGIISEATVEQVMTDLEKRAIVVWKRREIAGRREPRMLPSSLGRA